MWALLSLPELNPSMSAVAAAAEGLLLLRMQIFGVNVVSYRWLPLSIHTLTSILAVYTLLVSLLQGNGCVQTAPSRTANNLSVVTVYRILQVPAVINSLHRLLILRP